MAGRILPPEIMVLVGACLRQARSARGLSLEQAAQKLKIQWEHLEGIELGRKSITDIQAQMIIVNYGEARADRLDSILYGWALDEAAREHSIDRRKHLSLISSNHTPGKNKESEKPSSIVNKMDIM